MGDRETSAMSAKRTRGKRQAFVEEEAPAAKKCKFYYYQFGDDVAEGPTRVMVGEDSETIETDETHKSKRLSRTVTTVMERAATPQLAGGTATQQSSPPGRYRPDHKRHKPVVFSTGDWSSLGRQRQQQALPCVSEGGFDKDDEDVNCYRIRHRGDFYTVVLCNGEGGMVGDKEDEIAATCSDNTWEANEERFEFVSSMELS